jgi:hypothetical protein
MYATERKGEDMNLAGTIIKFLDTRVDAPGEHEEWRGIVLEDHETSLVVQSERNDEVTTIQAEQITCVKGPAAHA